MCEDCVKEEFPDRGNICLDSGVYLSNFQVCAQCHKKESLKNADREETVNDEGVEVIRYQHQCPNCFHVVASHKHTFWVDGEYQEYEMECILCGSSEDSVSLMPDDPRKAVELY